jgi:nitrate reductase gamma subunit
MPFSTLIRWGGLAAVVAGVLFIIVSLVNLFALIAGRDPSAVLVRTTIVQIAGAVLLFGLVGLYFRRSDELGIVGLIGFLG